MKTDSSNKTHRVCLRMTSEEFAKIEKQWKAGDCRKLSEYLRRHLFEKPIVTAYRNQSIDDFMAEMENLRTELNKIGKNFNQAVKRLHTFSHIPEIKNWLVVFEVRKETFFKQVEEIQKYIQKISERWSQ